LSKYHFKKKLINSLRRFIFSPQIPNVILEKKNRSSPRLDHKNIEKKLYFLKFALASQKKPLAPLQKKYFEGRIFREREFCSSIKYYIISYAR